uniref:RRM domain-containing protein n=1 Tax=Sexangularia sp. CB-2014 TaxID=1486929 RepID=A0A7S1V4S3_9EUKA|mmetsp:Transcript_11506/g.36571  ORF Transcript_11506/g.36571 Transcript_11506/m.36571 type:complete len:406 (+) Transcript_11506:129-1346(+)
MSDPANSDNTLTEQQTPLPQPTSSEPAPSSVPSAAPQQQEPPKHEAQHIAPPPQQQAPPPQPHQPQQQQQQQQQQHQHQQPAPRWEEQPRGGSVGGGGGLGKRKQLPVDAPRPPHPSRRKTAPPPGAVPISNRLFLGNLATNYATTQNLRDLFCKYGNVTDVVIKRSYGFVSFSTAEEAARAKAGEDGSNFGGSCMDIAVCDDRPTGTTRSAGRRAAVPRGRPGQLAAPAFASRDAGWAGGAVPPPPPGRAGWPNAPGYPPQQAPPPRGTWAGAPPMAPAAVPPPAPAAPPLVLDVPVFYTDPEAKAAAVTVANVVRQQTALRPTTYELTEETMPPELDRHWELGAPFVLALTKADVAKGLLTFYSFDPHAVESQGHFADMKMVDVINAILTPPPGHPHSPYARW